MNVFTLWGELKADTRNFEAALKRADAEIKGTEQNLSKLERQSKAFGQSSATVARTHEKFNDSIRATKQRLSDAVQAYDAGNISHKKMASVITQTDSKLAQLNSRIKDNVAQMKDATGTSSGMKTAFLAAAGATLYFAAGAIKDFESLQNRMMAATGSAEAAREKMAQLRALSLRSVGVDVQFAAFAFSQLKSTTTLADESVLKLIKSLGMIRTANPMADMEKYLINIQQLYNQNFEKQDLKEAIGNNPRFYEQLKAAFGTDNPQVLRAMKEAGKLSAEQWFNGLSDAVITDEKLKGLTDTPMTKIQKAWSNFRLDIGQLGDHLLQDFDPELKKFTDGINNKNYTSSLEAFGEGLGKSIVTGIKNAFSAENGGSLIRDWIIGEGGGFGPIFRGLASQLDGPLMEAGNKINQFTASIIAKLGGLRGMVLGVAGGVGRAIGEGIVAGLQAMWGPVYAAAADLAQRAVNAAKSALGIQSPSKVFYAIGKDVAQGFIDGIAAARSRVGDAIASLLDVSQYQKLTKKDLGLVKLFDELRQKFMDLVPVTETQAMKEKLLAQANLEGNAALKERLLLLAKLLDYKLLIKELDKEVDYGQGAADRGTYDTGGIGNTQGPQQEEDVPPPIDLSKMPSVRQQWENFWQMMRTQLSAFKESLPSFKQALGENLVNVIQGIGDSFANAMASWANGYESFSKALLNSFRNLVTQIVAELERLLVMKAIFAIIGAFSGGGIGGGSHGGGSIGVGGKGFASGGYTGGGGTSSFAGFVHGQEFVMNAQATKNIGVANLEAMNKGAMPSSPNITINVHGNASQGTIEQMARAVSAVIRKEQKRAGFAV